MSIATAYLIDFDGTLADTSEANYIAYAQALRECGIDIGREQFEREAFGRNWRQFLPELLAKSGCAADPAVIASRKVELYRDAASNVRFNEALILVLKNRNPAIKLGLVTSASAANVRSALSARAELVHMFDVLITGDDVTRHKPDPQGFVLAAERLGVRPENCVVFEDSNIGIEAALAFGANVLRVCMY